MDKNEFKERSELIYTMALHEVITFYTQKFSVMRVPGGWIYKFHSHDRKVFVPYCEPE